MLSEHAKWIHDIKLFLQNCHKLWRICARMDNNHTEIMFKVIFGLLREVALLN